MDGEFDLIARLRSLAEAEGAAGSAGSKPIVLASGDDAAITAPEGVTATSVDALLDGVHFRRATTPPRSVGRKALCAALSDLAAMGARAGEAYVIVGVPAEIDEDELLAVGAGLAAAAAEHGVAVLGGDVTRSPALWLGVTVVGHAAAAENLVTRSGARQGDAVVVTGELGGAAAGLALLERPDLAAGLSPSVADELRRRQLDPRPLLGAGLALAAAGARAMIDVSDGLGADAGHLAAASGVLVEIDLERVPIGAGVRELAGLAGLDPIELATAGGEDYELLASVPAERLEAAVAAVSSAGVELTPIGRVVSGEGVVLRSSDGTEVQARGFDQLAPRRAGSEPA